MSVRQALISLIEHQLIPEERINDAVHISGIRPAESNWLAFIDQLLLWLGILALSFSVLFFVAYNWTDIGRFAKFTLVQLALCSAIGVYLKFDEQLAIAKASLFAGSILVGVLLALYGQTYQTGADPWQLFFCWALLITPWAIVACFSAVWVLWLGLMNLAALLYFKTFGGFFGLLFMPFFGGEIGLLWCIFLLNTCALIIWELAATRYRWLKDQWATRLVATTSGVPITWLAFLSAIGIEKLPAFTMPVWFAWLAGIFLFYRYRREDLYMLAGLALSLSVVTLSFVAIQMFEAMEEHAFLPLALLVIASGTCAAMWLRSIHRTWAA